MFEKRNGLWRQVERARALNLQFSFNSNYAAFERLDRNKTSLTSGTVVQVPRMILKEYLAAFYQRLTICIFEA